jgi:hypothetical protein
MPDKEFRSPDKRFGLKLPGGEIARMVEFCRKAKRKETGGILVGVYTEKLDRAVVTAASKAPRDSEAGTTWFKRGVSGLQRWLKLLWKSNEFYLGEWHYHPFAPPEPSGTDISEMTDVSNDGSYRCPEPVLVILGGDPAGEMPIRAFVFPRGQGHVELLAVVESGLRDGPPGQ